MKAKSERVINPRFAFLESAESAVAEQLRGIRGFVLGEHAFSIPKPIRMTL